MGRREDEILRGARRMTFGPGREMAEVENWRWSFFGEDGFQSYGY